MAGREAGGAAPLLRAHVAPRVLGKLVSPVREFNKWAILVHSFSREHFLRSCTGATGKAPGRLLSQLPASPGDLTAQASLWAWNLPNRVLLMAPGVPQQRCERPGNTEELDASQRSRGHFRKLMYLRLFLASSVVFMFESYILYFYFSVVSQGF